VDVRSTYSHLYTAWAIQDFSDHLPDGRDDYLLEVKELAVRLYSKASRPGVRYFLDKTPKYHFIIEEIIELFPESKFLFLWRNPLSIIASIVETWGGGHWNTFYFKVDLFQGLDKLITAYQNHAENVCSLRFEDAVLQPEETWQTVFNYLEIPFYDEVINNFSRVSLEGRVQDPNTKLEEYQTIVASTLQKWTRTLNNPLRKVWARKYLRWIGKERLAIMGYDLDVLNDQLDQLPVGLNEVPGDILRMPLGEAYHLFELQLFKQKFLCWRNGQKIYMHN
jgi:hypothetical protein